MKDRLFRKSSTLLPGGLRERGEANTGQRDASMVSVMSLNSS